MGWGVKLNEGGQERSSPDQPRRGCPPSQAMTAQAMPSQSAAATGAAFSRAAAYYLQSTLGRLPKIKHM